MKIGLTLLKIFCGFALFISAIITVESVSREKKIRAQQLYLGRFNKCAKEKDSFRVEASGELLFFVRGGFYYRAEFENDRLIAYLPKKSQAQIFLEPVFIFSVSKDTLLVSGKGKYCRVK